MGVRRSVQVETNRLDETENANKKSQHAVHSTEDKKVNMFILISTKKDTSFLSFGLLACS